MKNKTLYAAILVIAMSLTSSAMAQGTATNAGALSGVFSVASGRTVQFSQGNLQYQASTGTWRFATNQWDYIGSANSNISSSYSGWIDLFGWGTSGWNNGNVYYQPYSSAKTANVINGYGYGPTDGAFYTHNLTGAYANADWGVYNAISNGGNAAGLWRTLTHDEWSYLFNSRTGCSTVGGTSNGRYALAQVNGVGGVIVFPDSYTHPSGVAAPQNVNSTSGTWGNNSYSASDWGSMQTAGAVFLPAAGYRDGTSVSVVGSIGGYWSSSYYNSGRAWRVYFGSGNLDTESSYNRSNGFSVRLVRGYTCNSASVDTINACDSYTWHGRTFTSSTDTATYHTSNAAGCDSVVTLHLTIGRDTSVNIVCSTGQTLTYNLHCSSGTATLTGYSGTCTGALSIPDSVSFNGITYPVTAIGDSAFYNCSGFTGSLTIGNNVVSIGDYAFFSCHRFTGTLTIPNSVTSIGNYAFRSCSGFTGTLTIPNSVTSIGSWAFTSCYRLSSLTIGNSVVSIGDNAFHYCSGFTCPLTIPNSVTSIGYAAFARAGGLTALTIPSSVVSIGVWAFFECSSLTSITVDSQNSAYDSRNNCNAIIETATNTLIQGCRNTVIPNTVTTIANYSFGNCRGLTSIIIPNSVTSMQAAFSGCLELTSIVVESGNSVYDNRDNCNAIIETATNTLVAGCQNTVIPNTVTSIRNWAFDAVGLTSIVIPKYVHTIAGPNAFTSNGNLTSIHILAPAPPISTGGLNVGAHLYVPCGSLEAYRTADGWSQFSNIHGLNDSITEYVSACDSYTWHGRTFTSSTDTATYTTTTADGCDINATLNLTVNYNTGRAYTQIACDSFAWHTTDYPMPTGTVKGLFSVSDSTQVYVSQGNLQYIGSDATPYWKFADHQYDYLGTSTGHNSADTNVDRDLFCWGTSGWNSGNTYYQPYNTDNSNGYGPVGNYNLTGSYANADWGVYNPISNGGNAAGLWRTLTYDEWHYLLSTRANASAKVGYATVAGKHGLILLPDSFTDPMKNDGSGAFVPDATANWSTNGYTSVDWAAMEAAGAVFLPAANSWGERGHYWSSSSGGENRAGYASFWLDRRPFTEWNVRSMIIAVRLVSSNISTETSDTYNSTGTYYHSYTAANGCASVDTLHLTIYSDTVYTDIQTACDSLVWIDGVTYTASNTTAQDTLVNAAGCDSVVTLNLTVNYSNTGTDVQTACDSYTWINCVTYTASNTTATDTLVNAAGCDSVVTLNLTLNYSNTGTDIQTACDSLIWINGVTYTASNITAADTLVNAAGCDSIVTLNLTLNYSNTGTDAQTACDSYTWIDGITYTASNSTTQDTLVNAAGCDSVVTLNLTINNSTTGSETVTACNLYVWHGRTLTASTDTATYHTTNAAGCDSTVTLHLTINNCSTTEVTACDSLTWNDILYTQSGTYTHGTDTLILTVNYSDSTADTATACNEYLWNGRTFTASTDTATVHLSNAVGCDSLVTLFLTISYDTNTGIGSAVCGQMLWHDSLYTVTGTYLHIDTTAIGCVNTDTLHLTVYYDSSTAYSVADTDSYTWVNHGDTTTYTASGTYTNSYTTADGCASTDTLHLTIVSSVPTYTVQVATANSRMGWASIDGGNGTITIERGRRCTLRANAYNGYHFVRWHNGSTANPYTITVTQDTMLVAVFESVRYTVSVVSGNPGRGAATGSGTAQYGSRRNISATAYNGYRFSHWNDGDTNASRTITVTGNITLTAYFDVLRFHIEALTSDSTRGTVTGGGDYDYLSYATLQATPANGYLFDRWSDGSTTNPRRIQVTADSTFTAYFVEAPRQCTLTVRSNDAAMGSASGGGNYAAGSAVTITATANSGYEFYQWDDGVTANPRIVTVNSDTVFTAMFRAKPQEYYTVTVASNDAGMGRVSGGGRFRNGSTTQLNAYPAAHCHFMRWSDGNANNPRNVTVDRDISLTALFARDSVTIAVRANDDRMGTVTGGGIYPYNATATLMATPNSGYRFVRWNDGTAANPLSVAVRYATTYTALFAPSTQGVDEADGAAVRVWGSDRTIHITGLTGGPLRVYDITGRKVAEQSDATGSIAIPMAYPGLYMVQTGTATHKVLLR